jgi:hypothetical protein
MRPVGTPRCPSAANQLRDRGAGIGQLLGLAVVEQARRQDPGSATALAGRQGLGTSLLVGRKPAVEGPCTDRALFSIEVQMPLTGHRFDGLGAHLSPVHSVEYL